MTTVVHCPPSTIVQVQVERPDVVVHTTAPTVVVAAPQVHARTTPYRPQVVVPCDRPRVVELVRRGPPGPQGVPGETEGATVVLTAGAALHGLRLVRVANGVCAHPSVFVDQHALETLGLALNAAAPGADVTVRTAGVHTEASWAWSPGRVFCGDDGVLTQAPASTGWLLSVGRALDATTLEIDLDDPILR